MLDHRLVSSAFHRIAREMRSAKEVRIGRKCGSESLTVLRMLEVTGPSCSCDDMAEMWKGLARENAVEERRRLEGEARAARIMRLTEEWIGRADALVGLEEEKDKEMTE